MSKFDELIAGLNQIATALLSSSAQKSPDLLKDLAEYPEFDWAAIGAEVLARDEDGATVVGWNGRKWKRRTHTQYGKDIWFSACTGKNEKQENIYSKLITFGEPKATDLDEVEPLPEKVRDALNRRRARAAQTTQSVPLPPPSPPPVKKVATTPTPQQAGPTNAKQIALAPQAPAYTEASTNEDLVVRIRQHYAINGWAGESRTDYTTQPIRDFEMKYVPLTEWYPDAIRGFPEADLRRMLAELKAMAPVNPNARANDFWTLVKGQKVADEAYVQQVIAEHVNGKVKDFERAIALVGDFLDFRDAMRTRRVGRDVGLLYYKQAGKNHRVAAANLRRDYPEQQVRAA